jgi:hypothetical protein
VDETLVLLTHLVHVEDEHRDGLVRGEHGNRDAGLESQCRRVSRASERLILLDVRNPHRLFARPRPASESLARRKWRDMRNIAGEQIGSGAVANVGALE